MMLALLVPGVGMGGGGTPEATAEAWWETPAWNLEWEAAVPTLVWETPAWSLEWEADMGAIQDVAIHKGERASLVFSPRAGAVDASGYSLRLDISRPVSLGGSGEPVLTLQTGGSGITATVPGVITCVVTRAQSLLLSGRYDFTLSRTDSGSEGVLAEGRLTVKPSARE